MLKRFGNRLKPHIRSFHFYSSTSARSGGLNGVTLSVISTAVAGTALWYLNAQNVYNDATGHSILSGKQKFRAHGTPTDPNTIYSLVWGSNRSVFSGKDVVFDFK